jgi:hypothetical protein
MLKQVKRSSGTGQTTATRPAELKQSYRQHRHTRHESENTHWHHSRAVTGDEKGRRLIVVLRDVCRATKHLAGLKTYAFRYCYGTGRWRRTNALITSQFSEGACNPLWKQEDIFLKWHERIFLLQKTKQAPTGCNVTLSLLCTNEFARAIGGSAGGKTYVLVEFALAFYSMSVSLYRLITNNNKPERITYNARKLKTTPGPHGSRPRQKLGTVCT